MPWHPPCALCRLILPLPSFSLLRRGIAPLRRMKTAVFLSPQRFLSALTGFWIDFVFPFSSLCSFQGAVSAESPLCGAAVRLPSSLKVFPILQNDTAFRSRVQSDRRSFRILNSFRCSFVALRHSFLTSVSAFASPEARPRIRLSLPNLFSLERR